MGSSSSRPKPIPFPVPKTGPVIPSKLKMWSFSSKKKDKKARDREKLDDFIMSKYPAPTATYPFPYYPQIHSTFPAYYTAAPVQMAFVQPMAVQQPIFAMPQSYAAPMVYQAAAMTTAAPVQPAMITTTQSGPAMQMPVPAPVHVAPQPNPPMPQPAPPPTAPTQIPQPPPPQVPYHPPSPIPANPVIPPHPIVNSEHRPAPDSTRVRFTDFYRPADASSFGPPPTSGPPGRTPYSGSMPMPEPSSTPGPISMPTPALGTSAPPSRPPTGPSTIPRSNNPLPPPPFDVWDTSPYRHVLANLPTELPDLLDFHQHADVLVGDIEPISRPSSRLRSLFSRDKGKRPARDLFRSRSIAGNDVAGPSSSSRHGHSRSQTVPSIIIPPPVAGAGPRSPGRGRGPRSGSPVLDMPVPNVGPPVKFDHTGDYAGFVNHSPHRVMYKNKLYPTALHLLEALKFTHEPALQERIRTCKDVNDMYPLSASFQEHVRPDWGQVFLKVMEDVLYLKFKQHPALRSMLLQTGLVDIIYADENTYWGEGEEGEGANELGKSLVRLRERLRQEGDN